VPDVLETTAGLDQPHFAALGTREYRDLADGAPDGMRFVVKAPLSLTAPWLYESREPSPHYLDPGAAHAIFVGPCLEGLGKHAGPLVFQLPPLGRPDANALDTLALRLHRFLAGLPRGPVYAVELRDRRLLSSRFMRVLAASGIRLALAVHARMPAVDIQSAAASGLGAGPLIVRWHLPPSGVPAVQRGESDESADRDGPADRILDEDETTRRAIARLARESLARGEEAWIVANDSRAAIERLARDIAHGSH